MQIGICEGLLMAKSKAKYAMRNRSFNVYPDKEAKAVQDFKEEMKDNKFVNIHRGYSLDVVNNFPDEYFDFVYIDADHTFDGCYHDICSWYPKVKKGGVISGHDFTARKIRTRKGKIMFGVKEAVNKFAKDNNLEFYILKLIVS